MEDLLKNAKENAMNKLEREKDMINSLVTEGVMTGSRVFFGRVGRKTDYDYIVLPGLYEDIFNRVKYNVIDGNPNYKGGLKLELDGKKYDVWAMPDLIYARMVNDCMKILEDNYGLLSKIGKDEYCKLFAIFTATLEGLMDEKNVEWVK